MDLVYNGKLTVNSFSSNELAPVVQKENDHNGLSLTDCSVWQFAETQGAIVLAGDGHLRKTAKIAGLELHVSLWILDELMNQKIIGREKALDTLKTLRAMNSRLQLNAHYHVYIQLLIWVGANNQTFSSLSEYKLRVDDNLFIHHKFVIFKYRDDLLSGKFPHFRGHLLYGRELRPHVGSDGFVRKTNDRDVFRHTETHFGECIHSIVGNIIIKDK